jgi:hypothetical protein
MLTATQKVRELVGDRTDVNVATKVYYSRKTIRADAKDLNTTYGTGYLVVPKQEVVFFDYGYGVTYTRAALENYRATRADTNLAKAKSTNGGAHFVIKRIGIKPLATLVEFDPAVVTEQHTTYYGASDADVLAALKGQRNFHDPQAIFAPAVAGSPFVTAHGAVFDALSFEAACFARFDGEKTYFLPPVHEIGQAGASSFARAHGTPDGDGAFMIDEELYWAPDGKTDGDFELVLAVQNPVVMPFALAKDPFYSGTQFHAGLLALHVDVMVSLEGDEYSLPSAN